MPEFDSISIGLASPEEILERSAGEVENPETTHSQSGKPKSGGLLCEKIFGPVEDYTCACGDYRPHSKGATCDKCGVEYTQSGVRRERMGHISLAEPVVHRWFLKTRPNRLGNLLGLKSKDLERVIYYENYIVIQPGSAERLEVEENQLLTEEEYREILHQIRGDNNHLPDDDPGKFIAKIGGEAIETMLEGLDLNKLAQDLRFQAKTETSQHRKDRALRRLKTVEAFREANGSGENRPEWMVMHAIPVIPPDMRPVVSLEEVRPAANDVNDLYRRVLIRNNRLKRLIDREAPESTLRDEKRKLQEAVDALFDNGRMSDPEETPSGRPLSSLGGRLRGKEGRFRKNLLSRRVDYSGRSVIVPGPRLELHQCGLPKEMAAELFKPFIVRRLMAEGTVETAEEGQKYVDGKTEDVLAVLEEVVQRRPVLLSRGPTIDQLGIWAFRPVLTDGKAIELHPLACPAYDAEFDGDELAVHVPLSHEAACESMALMSSSNHLLSRADGSPGLMPTQEIILGLYYTTKAKSNQKGEGMRFSSVEEVRQAYDQDQIALHAKIKLRDPNGSGEMLETTTGRVIFNETLPEGVDFVNEVLTTNNIEPVIAEVLKKTGFQETADFLDDIEDISFRRSTTSGMTFSPSDIIVPEQKEEFIQEANEKVEKAEQNYSMSFITDSERYNMTISIWTETKNRVSEVLFNSLKEHKEGFNPIFSMVEAEVCGRNEIRQLGGMGGLVARPAKSTGEKGREILEAPILSNYKEGLSPREYFSSTYGAREALAERGLKRGAADPLARRLMAAAQDEKIVERDCGTLLGIRVGPRKENEEVVAPLSDRITGRVSFSDVHDPHTDELLVEANELITEEIADDIAQTSIKEVEIRSVLTCEARAGICVLCYGQDLTTRRLVKVGEHIGGTAALTIGKHTGSIAVPSASGPEGQLTLPTSRVGALSLYEPIESTISSRFEGQVELESLQTVTLEAHGEPQDIVLSRHGEIRIIDIEDDRRELARYEVPYGSELLVEEGQEVDEGEVMASWDPYNSLILTEANGTVRFEDLIEGTTYREETDEQTGYVEKVVVESLDRTLTPTIVIETEDGEERKYSMPVDARVQVDEGDTAEAGQTLAKIPRQAAKTSDMAGVLPRLEELFEARAPDDPAVVTEIDGIVSFGDRKRGSQEVIVTSREGDMEKSYTVSLSKHMLVHEGDYVEAGDRLSDGQIALRDILSVKGPRAMQEHLLNKIQEFYRLHLVNIDEKHVEIFIRQMMKRVEITEPGDTHFLEGQKVERQKMAEKNADLYDRFVVTDPSDAGVEIGKIIGRRRLRELNSELKREGKPEIEVREARPAVGEPVLLGITEAARETRSWISAAAFQEPSNVLIEAAIEARTDPLEGFTENLVVGRSKVDWTHHKLNQPANDEDPN